MTINLISHNTFWKQSFLSGFRTFSLSVHPYRPEHFDALSLICRDDSIYRFVPDINSGEEFFDWFNSVVLKRNYLFHTIFVNSHLKTQIGGLFMMHACGDNRIEIGVWFGSAFHGEGYGNELVAGIVSHCTQNQIDTRLFAEIDPENSTAQKALVNAGFDLQDAGSTDSLAMYHLPLPV